MGGYVSLFHSFCSVQFPLNPLPLLIYTGCYNLQTSCSMMGRLFLPLSKGERLWHSYEGLSKRKNRHNEGYCRGRKWRAEQRILPQKAAAFSCGRTIAVKSELFRRNNGNQNKHTHNHVQTQTDTRVRTAGTGWLPANQGYSWMATFDAKISLQIFWCSPSWVREIYHFSSQICFCFCFCYDTNFVVLLN